MAGFLWVIERLNKFMQIIAGCSLTFIMLLTVADVFLRMFKKPIIGTFEIVGLGGAVAIGFAIPVTSWMRGHIFVDFFIQRFSKKVQNVFNFVTRLVGIVLFILIGWHLFSMGHDLFKANEVTLTIHIPFYPVAYALGVCCFLECLVLITDLVKIVGGKYE